MSNQNYNQARIYKISCNLPTINEIYIGSTADYEKRCLEHRSDCHNVNCSRYHYKVYNYIRANGGFGNFTIDVIEHYPCANKTAMRIREQYWINEYKPTLNTNRAYITNQDIKHYQKDYQKQYTRKVQQCDKCDKTYKHKTRHQKTKYCQNYKSTTSESSSESIINSDSDTD
jgi:predicted GIY-YIG superfamily endonuclease